MKTRIDLDYPIEDLALAVVFHQGDLWPGSDRLHYVWAVPALEVPPYVDGYVWAAPEIRAGATIRTALEVAFLTADLLVHMPNVVQDLCSACRGLNPGPNRPRWNIYRSGHPPLLTPCILEYWL